MQQSKLESYFYRETEGFEISKLTLVDTKSSYLWQVKCYLIETTQGVSFYLFDGDRLPMNLYPVRREESLNECYYKHVGLMTELCSNTVASNFIVDFLDSYSVFPILDRRIGEIEKDITLDKNSSQLSGIANQIRGCYLYLTDYLMNKVRSKNSSFKNDNFTDNLEEFLRIIIPGKQSDNRRNTINGVAQKGWKFNSELVHKESITVFDILISLNILKLVISIVCNLIVGDDMPFNRIKCPTCHGENISMISTDAKEYEYVCRDCNAHFSIPIEVIAKRI